MRPTWLVWPGLTLAVGVSLAAIAWWLGRWEALKWIAFGIATSAVTSVTSWLVVELARLKQHPLGRMAAEMAVRMGLPLGVLMVVAIVRREVLTAESMAYFLPFQLVTLVAGTNRSVVEVNQVR